MRGFHVSCLVLAAILPAAASLPADDPMPMPKGPRMAPLPTVQPLPTPMPSPDAAVTLEAGVEFLIDYTDECIVAAFPPNVLKIKHREVKAGQTLVLPGKFIDLDTGAKVVDEEREFKGPCHLYRVTAAVEDSEAYLVVAVVGQKQFQSRRIITGKGPRPPPKPPDPPPVVPVQSELGKVFQAAYDLEPAQVADKNNQLWTKADYVKKLAALYSGAAKVTVPDPGVKTYGDLFKDMQSAATFPPETMPKVRKAVGDYLDAALKPTSAKVIDKPLCTSAFQTVAAALKEVK